MGEATHMWGAGGIWKNAMPSAQYCCKPKTPLKNYVLPIFSKPLQVAKKIFNHQIGIMKWEIVESST